MCGISFQRVNREALITLVNRRTTTFAFVSVSLTNDILLFAFDRNAIEKDFSFHLVNAVQIKWQTDNANMLRVVK